MQQEQYSQGSNYKAVKIKNIYCWLKKRLDSVEVTRQNENKTLTQCSMNMKT